MRYTEYNVKRFTARSNLLHKAKISHRCRRQKKGKKLKQPCSDDDHMGRELLDIIIFAAEFTLMRRHGFFYTFETLYRCRSPPYLPSFETSGKGGNRK